MFHAFSAILLLLGLLCPLFPSYGADIPLNTPTDKANFAVNFSERFNATIPPQPVPSFFIQDGNNHTFDIKNFHGRYILLNIWATWCGPCVEEMPTINTLSAKIDPKKIVVMALNENSNGEIITKSFYDRHKIDNLPIYVDTTGRALPLLKIHGLPTTLLINSHGDEIGRFEGKFDWSSSKATAFLDEKMASSLATPN